MAPRPAGRLPDRSESPTAAGISIPAAVLRVPSMVARNFIRGAVRVGGGGELVWAGLAPRQRRRLGDPDVVAERVAQAHVGAVEMLHRLLGELDALRLEVLVGS